MWNLRGHAGASRSTAGSLTATTFTTTHKPTPRNALAYLIKSHANADPPETLLVVYNGTDKSVDLQLAGQWHIVVNEQKAGTATLQVISDRLRVESYSMLVGHDAP